MLTFDNVVFAEGIEANETIRLVAEWAAEKVKSADLVITEWDLDRTYLTDKASGKSYMVRTSNWEQRGKKRLQMTVTWTFYLIDENDAAVLRDEGFVQFRNGKLFGGSHLAG